MSQEPSPAVVEFGPASGPPDTPEVRRPILSRLLSGVRLDNRVVPALAGLGAVAVFVSLASPWQMTVVNADETVLTRTQEVTVGLTDLGGWGSAYLFGIFATAACTALVLFGAPEVRRHARLAGLGVSGALLATVAAIATELSRDSLVYPSYWAGQEGDPSVRSGLYLAFVGVAAAGGALYLAGRLPPPAGAGDGAAEGADGRAALAGLWRWRRSADPDPDEPPPPADLTVTPTRPFVQGSGR